MFKKIQEIDEKVAFVFPKMYHHHFLNHIMIFITGIGDFGMIWIGIVLILSTKIETRLLAQKILFALLLATIVGQVTIKSLVRRPRPCHRYKIDNMIVSVPTDFSFPSGHTTSSFACATTLFLFYPKIGLCFLIFACIMAFSRIYLFVHYLSDVVFAALLGITIAIVISLI